MNILVSIIIPTYNRAKLIKETLTSVMAQTYVDWECIVVDDGSTDDTEQIVTAFAKADSRIQFFSRPEHLPKGANACRNYGFRKSKGDYINWFDSDDTMMPKKLEVQVQQLTTNQCPYAVCQTERYDAFKKKAIGLRAPSVTASDPLNAYVQFAIFWTTGAPLWRRSFIETQSLYFDETLQQSQDYDFHINALAVATDYCATETPLMTLIRHKSNMSNDTLGSPEKRISNVYARYKALKNHHEKLTETSKQLLFDTMFDFFRKTAYTRRLGTTKALYAMIVKSLPYLDMVWYNRFKVACRWKVGYISYVFLGKGEVLLKPYKKRSND